MPIGLVASVMILIASNTGVIEISKKMKVFFMITAIITLILLIADKVITVFFG